MGSYSPQRIYEARFAWSPFKEATYNAAWNDAKLTHSCQPLGFDPPAIGRDFRSDAGKAWGGSDRATTRAVVRQNIAYSVNVELSALLFAQIAAFCHGVCETIELAPGPPAAYQHTITFLDPLVDGLNLPSTRHWYKTAPDLGTKVKGATCSGYTIQYTQSQAIVQLNSNWLGSGDYTSGDIASVPSLDTDAIMGTLFEKDLAIWLGPPGATVDIRERIAAFSLEVGNGIADSPRFFAGTGVYAGRAWQGKTTINPALTVFAKDVDDIRTLIEGDTVQELKLIWTGDTITGTYKFSISIDIPALHFGNAEKIGATERFVTHDLAPGDEGVFKPTGEPITIVVVNKEPLFLTA